MQPSPVSSPELFPLPTWKLLHSILKFSHSVGFYGKSMWFLEGKADRWGSGGEDGRPSQGTWGVPRGAGDPELTEWGGDDMCGDFKGNVCPVVSRPDKQRLWAPGPQRVLGAGGGQARTRGWLGQSPSFPDRRVQTSMRSTCDSPQKARPSVHRPPGLTSDKLQACPQALCWESCFSSFRQKADLLTD